LLLNIISSRISIIYFYALKFTFNSSVRIYGIHSVRYDSIKGQVRCIQTLTAQVEAPSLETSKFSLYFSGSCIPIDMPMLPKTIFTSAFLVMMGFKLDLKCYPAEILQKYCCMG
jgi:urate oxidase